MSPIAPIAPIILIAPIKKIKKTLFFTLSSLVFFSIFVKIEGTLWR